MDAVQRARRTVIDEYVGPLRGRLATTSAGVEIGLIRVMLAIRVANVIQLWAALPALYASMLYPNLNVALGVLYTAHSAAAVLLAARHGTLRWPAFVAADVAFMCFLLTVQPRTVPVDVRVGTWAAWAHPLTLSTAVLLAVGVRLPWAVAGVATLITAYVATSLPAVLGTDKQWTVMTNSVTFVAFALMGGIVAPYLRRLGHVADDGHKAAEALGTAAGAEAEMERHRRLLHDHASLLAHIGQRLFTDRAITDAVAQEALDGSRAVQAFLAQASGGPVQYDRPTLAAVSRETCARFPDLPLTINVDLAELLELQQHVADTLGSALHTLLMNVRKHSGATSCVVHAEASPSSWELTVRDDGVGFDLATTPMSFGLSRQVRAPCLELGLSVNIESAPGEGTVVRITSGPGILRSVPTDQQQGA